MSELIDQVNAYRMAVSTKAKHDALEDALNFINPSLYLEPVPKEETGNRRGDAEVQKRA